MAALDIKNDETCALARELAQETGESLTKAVTEAVQERLMRLRAKDRDAGVEIVALTPGRALIAREAHRDFEHGSGHRARLNLGDCFAYALAKDTGEALLHKAARREGSADFVRTDVIAAVPR
jgi:uncharacterized protein with PIN domain